MSDKTKLDDEIQQELEERLDDSEEMFETEEDFTVKVHREDYTVKRRFYDKGKALETADSLRKDKNNIVEDNFEHDFETPVAEEDDVDWDKLMDDDIGFFPPISDAAEKKLDETSRVAEELAAESARVGSELDKTLTMGSGKVPNYPKIEPKDKPSGKKEIDLSEIDDSDLEIDEAADIDIEDPGEIDLEVSADDELLGNDEETDDEMLIDENDTDGETADSAGENRYGKKSSPVKKLMVLLVVIVSGGLYYYFTLPEPVPEKATVAPVKKAVQQKHAVQKKVVVKKKPVEPPAPEKGEPPVAKTTPAAEKKTSVDEVKKEKTEPVEPVLPEKVTTPPEVTKNYPYTIHISSYKSEKKADSEVIRIRKKGYDAFWSLIEIPGKGGWRRIYTGYYETYTEATAALKELKKTMREDAVVAKTFFGVQVGSVAEMEDLTAMETQLREKGYTPYYLPVSDDGKYVRLMVGAYKFDKDISGLLKKLIKDGFDAEVVKR